MALHVRGPTKAMIGSVGRASRIARRLAVALTAPASLSACALGPSPETAQVAAMQQPPVCRPDPALLTPPAAPDCAFGRLELKTLDPDRWARLKLEYERKCYQQAEKNIRERLSLLQAASRC